MPDVNVYILITKGERFSFIHHYAIYVQGAIGGDYVWNCTLDKSNSNGGCSVKEDYTTFIADHEPIYFLKTDLTEDDVNSKIAELNNKHWLSLWFNCSDYTRRFSDISPFYSQKNILIAGLLIAGALVYVNYKM